MPIGGRIVGPGGGGAPADPTWTVEAEIDFAAWHAANGGTTVDFLTPGTAKVAQTIDGVDWQAASGNNALSAYADLFQINANGLQIQPRTPGYTYTNYYGNSTWAPRLGVRLRDIIPSYDYSGDTIAIQAYATADTLSDTYQAFGLTFGQHVDSHVQFMAVQAKFSGLANPNELIAELISNNREHYANPPQHQSPDFFEVIVSPRMGAVSGSASNWQGSFPDPGAPLVADGWAGIRGASVIKNRTGPTLSPDDQPVSGGVSPHGNDGYASALAHGYDSNTPFTATTHKMRFLRLKR